MKVKFLIIVFLITISSFSQNAMPTYKEVVTKLYNLYDVDFSNTQKTIQFEKRAIGWKVTRIDNESNDTINELFWDNQKKKYNKINFSLKNNSDYEENKENKENKEYEIDNYIKSTSYERFNSLEYYGYVGWDEDLIQLYENKKELSDNELYVLGYAYSNYAQGLLNENFGFSNDKVKFNLPIATNSMTNDQLQTYLLWQNKAIDTYFELYKRNPKFETIVGQIGIKYYNEIASNFLNLRIYQNEEIALAQLKDKELYSENYKEYAKSTLDSCEKDAILFTMGDNDTYSLLVYQTQYKYRTDVLIVNTALIQVPHYINTMMNNILDSEGIKLSISLDFIKDKMSEAFLFTNKTKDFISIENLNSVALDESNLYESYIKSYKTIPSNNFTFNENDSVLNWQIKGGGLYRSHLIMLDIIATNKWKRPIYFAANGSDDVYLGLSKYLQFEGLVYKLVSNEGENLDYEIGFVNPSKLEQNMKTMFQFNNLANLPIEERQLVMEFRLIYKRLADFYIRQENFKKAETLLDESIRLYPNDLAYFSFDMLPVIESYFKVKSYKKAKILENQLLQNFENKFDNYSLISKDERKIKYERTKENLRLTKEIYQVK